MTKLKVLGTVLVCCLPCFAQENARSSWETLQTLRAGERVRVDTAQAKQSGSFESVDGDAITFRSATDQVIRIARADVLRVSTRSRSSRLRNLLIGAGVGTAIGAILYGTVSEYLRNESGDEPALLVVPIVAFTAVGAALPTGGWKEIYNVKP